jgi:hypothetical protein
MNRIKTVLRVHYLTFCVAQHVSGVSTPIIRSLQLHYEPLVLPLERGGSSAVGRGLATLHFFAFSLHQVTVVLSLLRTLHINFVGVIINGWREG